MARPTFLLKVSTLTLLLKCLTSSEVSENCNKVELVGPGGAIFSPGYPDYYHNHTSCTWYLSTLPGDLVTIKFKDLDIEEDAGSCGDDAGPCCNYNWVKVEAANIPERKFCGSTLPQPLYLDSRKVNIKFHTSMRVRGGRGFRLTYVVGKCIEGKIKCKSIDFCYEPIHRCDGSFDCPDYSDELDCGGCLANRTACGTDSECYNPFTQHCDGIVDCLNGNDEKGCSRSCEESIRCSSGIGCYSETERCDGVTNCGDASDEKNCGPELCRSERGGFLCGNGHCIREAWKCDRMNDCGDGSDEANCLKNSVITAAIMGSLICGLLLVVAISCSCKLYSLRHTEQQLSCRETPLFNMEQEFVYREPPPPYSFVVGNFPRPPWTTETNRPASAVLQAVVAPATIRSDRRPRRPHRRLRLAPPNPANIPGTSSEAPVVASPADAGVGQGTTSQEVEGRATADRIKPLRKMSSESNKSDEDKTTTGPTQGEFRNYHHQPPLRSTSNPGDYLCDNLVVISDSSADDAPLIPLEHSSSD